ncbi:hypothetical protein [uncultured Streptococcus sp.]|uniref:hypothetical protein n=1 Tax=uncultured Streptococcus sp. TaxID=83427 RepID=UPI0025FF63F4|nr:hypothetical protein [uncultured Streptococcus sp.]
MNTKIRSRTAFPRMLEETLFKAYQEGKRSVDFLLLTYSSIATVLKQSNWTVF